MLSGPATWWNSPQEHSTSSTPRRYRGGLTLAAWAARCPGESRCVTAHEVFRRHHADEGDIFVNDLQLTTRDVPKDFGLTNADELCGLRNAETWPAEVHASDGTGNGLTIGVPR